MYGLITNERKKKKWTRKERIKEMKKENRFHFVIWLKKQKRKYKKEKIIN